MFSSVSSGTLFGMSVYPVQVEADMSDGMPMFELVGYLAGEVKEARERVRTALRNSGYRLPPKRITVNLSPADRRKKGTSFDLPIAVALLKAMEALPDHCTDGMMITGELSLSGHVKGVRGVLAMVMEAKRNGFRRCIVPMQNVREGSVVQGIEVYGVRSLAQTAALLKGNKFPVIQEISEEEPENEGKDVRYDFADIRGQKVLKRALEIAVSGNHNILLIGPPGAGKSMAAGCLPGILPSLTKEERMEVTKIYSIAGMLSGTGLVTARPFISPHHSVSAQALAGNGAAPGLVSLAHRGVLFLDELPEFNRAALEIMRQPLEEKEIRISRVNGNYVYPADFMLAAAMNPCKCGYYPDLSRCRCSDTQIGAYLSRISRPLLDRIDICVEASRIRMKELKSQKREETSEKVQQRVEAVRNLQRERLKESNIFCNGAMGQKDIARYCILGKSEERLMENAYDRLGLTVRAYHKILRVSRTIADMDGEERIREKHLCEAIGYREIAGIF